MFFFEEVLFTSYKHVLPLVLWEHQIPCVRAAYGLLTYAQTHIQMIDSVKLQALKLYICHGMHVCVCRALKYTFIITDFILSIFNWYVIAVAVFFFF